MSDANPITHKDFHSFLGRRKILTGVCEVTAKNIGQVLSDAFSVHERNRVEIRYLREYYKGNQPILERVKEFREEINNKIVENRAFEIVEFKKGYVFGEPIQFVQRGDCAFTKENEMSYDSPKSVQALNELMSSEGKDAVDSALGEDMFITGTAFRYVLPKREDTAEGEAPFKICALSPENTFVVYSAGAWQEPVLAVNYVDIKSESEFTCRRLITAYTKDFVYEIETDSVGTVSFSDYTEVKPKKSVNGVGYIPIIEYPLNRSRMGCFEPVLGLLDAINNTESNRMDGIEQFIQSFVKFIDCDITKEQFEDLKRKGALLLVGVDGKRPDAQIMESSLDQQQTQTYIDHLYESVLTICGVPDREASAGGNTGQALIIGQGWASAEARAKAVETMFKRSEKSFLKVVMAILENTVPERLPQAILSLRLEDIDIKFTRNRTDSLLVKTQGLQNMLESGVHPRIALSTVGLFSDPEQVYQDSLEYLKKWEDSQANSENYTPANQKSVSEEEPIATVEVTG